MSEPQSFDVATQVERLGETEFSAEVPDGWQQGRGAFGGLVIGLCVRAMDAVQGSPERPLRSLSAQIPSPVLTGATRLEVSVLRRGRGVDTLEVRLLQEGEVRARATGLYGAARPIEHRDDPPAPTLPPRPAHQPMPPRFTTHFEMASTGPAPLSGSAEARVEGWVRPRVAFRQVGAPEIACLCDVFWPAAYSQLSEFRPAATLGYMLQTTPKAFELQPGAAAFFRSRQVHAAAGFSHELRELWSEAGELLALNTQTFVIIK